MTTTSTTASRRTVRTAVHGLETIHVTGNPLRRGPVVLATDGSGALGGPVIAAQLIAERLGLPLSIVSVLEPSPTFASSTDVVVTLDPALDERRARERETHVIDYVGRFAGGAAPSRVHVRTGNVATEIARFAREVSATIVVMGSAPHRRFHHTVSGLRVARVLHHSPCPVLSVPPTLTTLPRVVAAAVDFGPSSARAAQAAMLLVADGGTVVLTHVLPPPVRPEWLRMVSEQELAVSIHALFDLLLEEVGPSVPDGVTVETRSIAGDTIQAILSLGSACGAEAFAVGTRGPGPIARAIVGSVAESVLHRADQAVLVSPPPPADETLEGTRRTGDAAISERDHAWITVLDAFSRRHAGHSVVIEAHEPGLGASVAGRGYTFLGATYEPACRRVEIMMSEPGEPRHHVTRTVSDPEAITLTPAAVGGGETLDIRHGPHQTILTVAGVGEP